MEFDPIQYYNFILQQNGADLDDKTGNYWGLLSSFATPLLAESAGKLGQEIKLRRANKALTPLNFHETMNSVVESQGYQDFVNNASNINRFQADQTYENASSISKTYSADRQKIFSKFTKGKLNVDQYLDSIQQLNDKTIQSGQSQLRKQYSGLTNKYKGATNFDNFQSQLDQRLNLDIGAQTNFSLPDPTTQLTPKIPTLEQRIQNAVPVPELNLPQVNLPQLNGVTPDLTNLSGSNQTVPAGPSQTTTPDVTKTQSFGNSIKTAGAGALGGMATSMGVSALGNALGAGNSKAGQMATGVASQIAGQVGSTVAENLVGGASAFSGMGSSLLSASSLAQGGMGLANIALDVFDPVKKSKGENIFNMGVGGAALIGALAGAGPVSWAAGGLLLGANVIGHAFGQKTRSFTADKDLLAQTNGSYGGSVNNILTAQSLAGQKHSLWDNGGRHSDDEKIGEADRQQETLGQVIGYNNDRRNIALTNANIYNIRKSVEENGNYDQRYTARGKNGMVLRIKRAFSQRKMQQKRRSLDPFSTFIDSLPEEYKTFSKERWEQEGSPSNFGEAIGKGIFSYDDSGWKVEEFKEGGSLSNESTILEVELFSEPDEFKEGGVLQEVELIEEFKEGGSFNVIPDGALHARLHHMEDADNLTKKGIPVVAEKDGQLEQQAEIEKEEIILRLSLTKKLEELAKEDTEESAIEAGKLLVEEILNNTIDNTKTLL